MFFFDRISEPVTIKLNPKIPPNTQPAATCTSFLGVRPKLMKNTRKLNLTDGETYCGEDAYFIACNKKAYCFGVADGVGGWIDEGVDPSEFSWSLMQNCKYFVLHEELTDPIDILQRAFSMIVENKQVQAGSSTACIISITNGDKDKRVARLTSANFGDSGFIVIRGEKLIYESTEMLHSFNTPYQLAVVPSHMEITLHSKPSDAQKHSMELRDGDIIVLATDGLWDNVFTEHIVEIVNSDKELENVTRQLIHTAAKNSISYEPTPFSHKAKEQMILHEGGKYDDITIIVAKVNIG